MSDWGIVTPFWIDTDAYSDRDHLMFCCGVEFEMVRLELESGNPIDRSIHTENESRLKLLCSKSRRQIQIIPNVAEGWSRLIVKGNHES